MALEAILGYFDDRLAAEVHLANLAREVGLSESYALSGWYDAALDSRRAADHAGDILRDGGASPRSAQGHRPPLR
jgi:hypothetical protein